MHVHFSSNLYIALLSTYFYHIFDLCIQKDIQDTFHLRCDICPPDNSEDIVWNNSLRKTLVLGNLINVKSNKIGLVGNKIKKFKGVDYFDIKHDPCRRRVWVPSIGLYLQPFIGDGKFPMILKHSRVDEKHQNEKANFGNYLPFLSRKSHNAIVFHYIPHDNIEDDEKVAHVISYI